MEDFNWTCPHCTRDVTVIGSRQSIDSHTLRVENRVGQHTLFSRFIVCPNPKCGRFTISVALHKTHYAGDLVSDGCVRELTLVPASSAVSFPSYVPLAVRQDYEEACSIVELSPKASATLARRALQGIIRDFWGIRKSRLIEEIESMKEKVDPLTWDAIDATRRVGNIGAHMETDINVIVDVDPDEAALLVGLIETLVKDSYIARENRRQQMEQLKDLGRAKVAAKDAAPK
jgi:hypothetical protein